MTIPNNQMKEKTMAYLTAENEEKFNILYERYQEKIFRYINRILKDFTLSEDVSQQTFIQVMRNVHRIEDVDSKRTQNYIYKIAQNASFYAYNQRKKEALLYFGDSRTLDQMGFREKVVDITEGKELALAFSRIPASDGEILALRHFSYVRYDEIASYYKISEAAARKRMERARKRLQEEIEKLREEERREEERLAGTPFCREDQSI